MSTYRLAQVENALEGSNRLNQTQAKIKKFTTMLQWASDEVSEMMQMGILDMGQSVIDLSCHMGRLSWIAKGDLETWFHGPEAHAGRLLPQQDLPRRAIEPVYRALPLLVDSIEERIPGVIRWLEFFEKVGADEK
jgi:hypothetical protein